MSDERGMDMPEVIRKWDALRFKAEQVGKERQVAREALKEAEARHEMVSRDFASQTEELRRFVAEAVGDDVYQPEPEAKEMTKGAW